MGRSCAAVAAAAAAVMAAVAAGAYGARDPAAFIQTLSIVSCFKSKIIVRFHRACMRSQPNVAHLRNPPERHVYLKLFEFGSNVFFFVSFHSFDCLSCHIIYAYAWLRSAFGASFHKSSLFHSTNRNTHTKTMTTKKNCSRLFQIERRFRSNICWRHFRGMYECAFMHEKQRQDDVFFQKMDPFPMNFISMMS